MSDVHTLSTWIKPICICTLSSWPEIYSRIIFFFFLRPKNHICSWDCFWVKKCGIFIANSICIQYADLQILDSLPKIIVKQTGWLAAFSWWTRRNLLKRGRVLAKISDHGFIVCTMQCDPASPRWAGMSLQQSTFLTGIWAWILGKCQQHSDEPWQCGDTLQGNLCGARSGASAHSWGECCRPTQQHPQVTPDEGLVFKGV